MQLKGYLLILSLSVASCAYNGRKNNDHAELDSLINTKKDSLLFLSFWSKMSEQEFKNVEDMENRKGNLHNNKFYFFTGDGNDSVGFKLERPYMGEGINLEYKNENWMKGTPNYPPSPPISWNGITYQEIEKSLKKHFDSKYTKLDHSLESSMNEETWITNEVNRKVIEMSWRYFVRDSFHFYDSWEFKSETSEFKWAECYFNIRILSLHDYEQQQLNYSENKRLREAKEEEERRKKENSAKTKNSKL